jgi:YVTN family beta-propeller protein
MSFLRVSFRLLTATLVAVAGALSLVAPAVARTAPRFAVIKTINVDYNPFGITASPDGRTMWVANSGGVAFMGGHPSNNVTIIDVRTLREEPHKITVGSFPEHIAFTRDGAHAAVTNGNDSSVSFIDVASRRVTQTVSIAPLGLAYPFGVIFTRDGQRCIVTTGGGFEHAIAVLDTRNFDHVSLLRTLPVSGYPGIPTSNPLARDVFVPSSLAQIGTGELFEITADRILRSLSMPINNAFANDIAVTPDGRYAYITIFAFTGGEGGVWVVDLKHLRTVTMIHTGDQSVYGVGITPNGRYALATNFNANQVAVIEIRTNRVIATVPVGTNPNQVAFTRDGSEAFITNQGDTTVSVISIPHGEM